MKKLLAAVVLATVLSSPALAQSYDPSIGSGNLNAAPYRSGQPIQSSAPHDARAQLLQFGPSKSVNVGRGKRR